jgi:hypothetical protein
LKRILISPTIGLTQKTLLTNVCGKDYYLEPHVRYYSQGAADFFHYYLVSGEAVPQYASADTRLAKFHAQTYGTKFGIPFDETSEFNVRIEYYD